MKVYPYCLLELSTQEKLDKHKIDCIIHTAVRVDFTNKKNQNSLIIIKTN